MILPARAAANEFDLRGRSSNRLRRMVVRLACELPVGMSFVFLTDLDPEPLNSFLQAFYKHQFFWNYLTNGPALWRVQVGRLQRAP